MKICTFKMYQWLWLISCAILSQGVLAQPTGKPETSTPSSLLLSRDTIPTSLNHTKELEVGYGTQTVKAISSAIAELDVMNFNQGLISDPAQLIQGKVAGLQVYNRGGDPNRPSLLRVRGASLGANPNPIIVIDGIIGTSLEILDPNDIERISVLKDAAATAIYGARAGSGVILIETKKANAKESGLHVTYLGQGAVTQMQSTVPIMDAVEFRAAGGVDLGNSTNWNNEIMQTGWSQTHGLVLAGTYAKSNFRLSANYRDVEGVLRHAGFEQLNFHLNFNTKVLNDRLSIGVINAYSHRESNYSFTEAFQYAVRANPTAPIFGADAPLPFESEQYGGYYETLGLYDSFNPVSILEQNSKMGLGNKYLLTAHATYQLSDKLKFTGRFAHENLDDKRRAYYPTTALFRGNAASPTRKGRVDYLGSNSKSNLYEAFFTYERSKAKKGMQLLVGYTHQHFSTLGYGVFLGDFEDRGYDFLASFTPPLDLQDSEFPISPSPAFPGFTEIYTNSFPQEKLDALLARAMFNWRHAIFLNVSLRSEKSKLVNVKQPWNISSAISLGVDLNKYMKIATVDQLKLRAGWGTMGSLTGPKRLRPEIREVTNGSDGSVSTELVRSPVVDNLRAQRQNEFNLGIDVVMSRFQASVDAYSRRAENLWLKRELDPNFGIDNFYENNGQTLTQGVELSLGYELISNNKVNWQSTLIASTYKTTLEDYYQDEVLYGNLGVPGLYGTEVQRRAIGEQMGQIWGPVFTGVNSMGEPVFADLNGDGVVNATIDQALNPDADFQVLGNGLPAFELGWGHQISLRSWSLNVFFRSALGHSLVNMNRVTYEPYVSVQSSYNYVNTELRDPALTTTHFSSLYVERADFLKLDNLTLTKRFRLKDDAKSLNLSLSGQNLWVWTNYTGLDPEPVFSDYGATSNGGTVDYNSYDAAISGLDRRYSYWPSQSLILGLKLKW